MIEQDLIQLVKKAVHALYGIEADDKQIQLQKTRPEFEGNMTVWFSPL